MTKLQAIAEQASKDLVAFMEESEVQLTKAWTQMREEAELNETKDTFRIGFTISLSGHNMETRLTFGSRHKLSRDQEIPDPAQLTIKLKEA